MIRLTFLSAEKRLTKTLILKAPGEWSSIPYPLVSACTSHDESINTIEEFHTVLVKHSTDGHALLRGNLTRAIRQESRAGLTAASTTEWLVIDFDGFELGRQSIDDVLVDLGLGSVDYILQYSASHGIKAGLSAHVFMLLENTIAPEALKLWLKSKNLTISAIRNQISLTRTGMALHLPVDICVADLSRLIYIGVPTISGGPDPVAERITLVKGTRRKATISGDIPGGVDAQAMELLLQLRKTKGLVERKFTTKFVKSESIEVLANPDKLSVTGEKADGIFTRTNINGSASWGYYYLTANPEILHNFRGEPPVLLKECATEYYRIAKNRAKTLKLEAHNPKNEVNKVQRWLINRADTGQYQKITLELANGVKVEPCPTLKHASDWCTLHGLPMPEVIEDWSVSFTPTSTEIVNSETKTINTYRPTTYRINSVNNGQPIPPTYWDLILHVCGNDAEAAYYFLNWLSYIWQTGKRPKTAWVLGGTYGTGKGRLIRTLKMLFGAHCVVTGPEGIEDKFNGHLKEAQIVFLDELTTDSWDANKMTPKLRSLIDGESGMREMRKAWENAELYFGLIIAGNEHNVVEIRFQDRRFNVAPRQEIPLVEAPWVYDEYELFDDEHGFLYQPQNLQDFANGLYSYAVDVVKVRRPLANKAKEAIMRVTQSLPEDIVQALDAGNAGFFAEYVPPLGPVPATMETIMYTGIVEKMMRGGKVALSLKELSRIFEFLAGWASDKPGKFTKASARFGLDLRGKTAREGNVVFAGTYFVFHPGDEDKARWAQRERKLEVVRDVREK
jgi:hypothetical protein